MLFLKRYIFIPLTVLSFTGCTSINYMQLESKYVSVPQAQSNPEVIATATYTSLNKNGLTVAVKAPDMCSSYTADQRSGEAKSSETILKTDCGLEMGEIERALAKNGFNVISWKAFNQQIAVDNNLTKAANTLGAQVIFQINSLENSFKNLGKDARWERNYAKSNRKGEYLMPLKMPESNRTVIANTFLEPIEKNKKNYTYAVTLDAAAIQVNNGQAIWYYRWTKAAPPSNELENVKLYLACDSSLPLSSCSLFTPMVAKKKQNSDLASGDTVGVSDSEKPENIARATYAGLYREVVNNLVQSFATSKQY